jgi:hypothetical protein
MFGPCIGIPEDPATGAASGPLSAYLLRHNAVSADNASRLVNLQGVRMGLHSPTLRFLPKRFFEPMVGVGLGVERLNFDIA